GVNLKCGDRNKNGQQASGEKINPGTACGRHRVLQLFPAERSPEREPAQHRQRDIEEQKNQGVPEHIAAEKKLRLIEEVLLELLLRQGLVWGVIEGQDSLHQDKTRKCKKHEDDEMRPGPGNTQVFRKDSLRLVRSARDTRGVGNGITGERFSGRMSWRLGHGR